MHMTGAELLQLCLAFPLSLEFPLNHDNNDDDSGDGDDDSGDGDYDGDDSGDGH